MKNQNKNSPKVNPPKMKMPDLSDAEMEVKERIEKREKGENMYSYDNASPKKKKEDSKQHGVE